MPSYNDMNTGFEFMNNPIIPGAEKPASQPFFQEYTQPQQLPSYDINKSLSEPQIATPEPKKKSMFTVIDDDEVNNTLTLPAPDVGLNSTKKTRKKKEVAEIAPGDIVRAEEPKQELSTMYNYAQTTALLGDTLGQVDMLAGELKNEFDNVMTNRTLKNKYMILTNLSESMSQLLNTKTTIIREINNSITKAIDLDYKKERDRLAAEGIANDNKYIMDMYNSFVNNPNVETNTSVLGPSTLNTTVNGSSIVRAPINNGGPAPAIQDQGFLNYISNVSPEQNAMFYEKDPNVKTVVVYDMSNGNKFFQVMNLATGQVVPNVPVMDNRFLDDTTIDLRNKIAKNTNLRETYPLVIINDTGNVASQY